MIVELEVDGEIIEVEESELERLLAKIRKTRPDPPEKVIADTLTSMVHTLALIPGSIEKGVAGVKIPVLETPKAAAPVQKIVVSNVQRGRNNLIESLEMRLVR
jgi:hypothetical protein